MPRSHTPSNAIKAHSAEVDAIYRELETRPVERNCLRRGECCQFKLTGKTPFLTRGEAMRVAEAFRASGRRKLRDDDGICPMLDRATLRCIVYESRPFGCRTHFCKAAGGPYARSEVSDLIRRLEEIDRALGGDGPHQMHHAVQLALNTRSS
jgi:Fe-S-cluster containining protein